MASTTSKGGSPKAGRVRPHYLPFGRPNFSSREIAAVAAAMRKGWIGMGGEVQAFEGELEKATGAKHVVTVSSCTDALFLALKALGVGPGDEVVVPSLTWCSTANAALYAGATPALCDVDPDTLCATPATVKAALTPRTKAVIVVHYGGRAADADGIAKVLPKGVALVEDAAHAFGAKDAGGKPVGSSGRIACFSFYANKNLSTGEGGALALGDGALADKVRSLRQHGLPTNAWKRFSNPKVAFLDAAISELGYKMNYTDLQAAIGRVQLARQGEFAKRRLEIAKLYERGTVELGLSPLPGQCDPRHARHLFVARVPDGFGRTRDELFLALRALNVGVSLHYTPLHKMPLYAPFARAPLPATEAVAGRIFTLPISASMTTADARYVLEALRRCL